MYYCLPVTGRSSINITTYGGITAAILYWHVDALASGTRWLRPSMWRRGSGANHEKHFTTTVNMYITDKSAKVRNLHALVLCERKIPRCRTAMIASWFTGYGRVGLRVLSVDVKINNCSVVLGNFGADRPVTTRVIPVKQEGSSETGICKLPSYPSSLPARGT